jgi:SAM-dependent methyltransferase
MFWDDAATYDLATGLFRDDLAFWTWLLERDRPRRVLDLGAGTGRITLALAARGRELRPDFAIVGLDLSQPFLQRAAEKLAATPLAGTGVARFVHGDIRNFACLEPDGPYDLIICGFNTLAYLHDLEDQLACLGCVLRHLAPGGRFAIDLFTPMLPVLAEARVALFPVVRKELDWSEPEPGVQRFLSLYTTNRYDTVSQTEYATHIWDIFYADGRRMSRVKDLAWHHFFPRELRLLLRLAGLVPVEEYGDYDRTPFGDGAAHYLWIMAAAQ